MENVDRLEIGAFWLELIDVLRMFADSLTDEWPRELPPEDQERSESFWMAACHEEMRTRQTLSAKIRTLLGLLEQPSMDPLESWLFRRRIEWAAQLAADQARRGKSLPPSLPAALVWALVDSWETDGCQGMWSHAERGGVPHPESDDWIRDPL